MKKNIIIAILIFLIIAVSYVFLIREGINLRRIKSLNESMAENHRSYEITLVGFISDYWKLYQDYQLLLNDYREAAYEEIKPDALSDWSDFEVTAYTSNECGTITSTGLDLTERYAKYLNVCAVDPGVVPYGSTLLIEFADGQIKSFIAMDCGGFIKGKKIDLYFTDVEKAMEFGRQKLKVMVIN